MNTPKVLLVDDEPNIRWTMAEFLKREGYDTLVAEDFDSAVAIADSTDIDAAVIDIILPGKSGIELLKELRSRESYIPMIMITGEPNLSQMPELLRAGAYDFIAKPVVKEVLVKAVSRAVEKKQLIDEKRRLEQEIKNHVEKLEARVAERTRELAESEARFRAQYKGIPVPTYSWRKVGDDFVLVDYNDATETFTRGTVVNLVGRKASEVYRERPDILADFSRCSQEQRIIEREMMYRLDSTGENKHLDVSYVSVPPDLIMAHVEDITDRKRADEALRESEKRYRLLFESNPLPIWVYDRETLAFLAVNEAAVRHYGYSREEFLSMTIKDIRPLGDISLLLEMTSRVSPEVEKASSIGKHRKKDGTIISVEISWHSLRFAGRPAELVLANDVTEREGSEDALRQMQARLAHSEKISALGRVAAQVAHEVKNPLAGLLLYALHFKGKVAGKLAESEMSLIDKIIDVINHLSNTVEQILNFARPLALTPRRLDINRLITDVIPLLEPQMAANKIEEKLDLSPAAASGMFDEASIRSALTNLLLNAIQAMPAGGTLNVATNAYDKMVSITIADTGEGMTEDQVKKIFEPFYTTKSQGLGLGMPYAQRVIEQHQGTIQIESQMGAGTRIKISLPAEE